VRRGPIQTGGILTLADAWGRAKAQEGHSDANGMALFSGLAQGNRATQAGVW